MNLKKTVNILSYYIIPLIIFIISFLNPVNNFFNLTGRIAEILLILILMVKPIAILTKSKIALKVLQLRRPLGVLIFWFALVHTAGWIYLLKLYSVNSYLGFSNHLFWAAIAMIGMFILAITSNNISVRYFKRNWKKVQYLAYPVLFATLLHSSIIMQKMPKFFVISIIYIILKVLEYRKLHKH